MRLHAIINERAGTALGGDQQQLKAAIEAAFVARGHSIATEFVAPADFSSAIEKAATTDADALIVGGGDGSVRTAARIAMKHGKTLGILPLGTLNRLARDLGIPLGLAEAAAALASGQASKIDVASVNDQIYLCNSLLGLPPEYSTERQKLRGRPFTERMRGYARVIRNILSSRKRLHITFDDGREQKPMRVLSLAIANNAYCERPGFGLTRPNLDGGELAVYASRHRSGWAMVRALIRAVLGRWHGDPHLEKFRGRELTVRVARSSIRLSNDGEVATFTTPLRYKLHPKALNILLPVEAA